MTRLTTVMAITLLCACGGRAAGPAAEDDAGLPDSWVGPAPEIPPPCPASPCVAGEPCVQTLAGSGLWGQTDGPAVTARFTAPDAIACDAQGKVYVGDGGRLRVIANGVVSTLTVLDAGGAELELNRIQGLDVDDQGRLYVADGAGVYMLQGNVGVPVPGSDQLVEPIDVAVDGDTVYVVDHGNIDCFLFCDDVVRRAPHVTRLHHGTVVELPASFTMSDAEIDLDTAYIFAAPMSVAVGPGGVLYMPTDTGLRKIQQGTATDIPLDPYSPVRGIAVDGLGQVYGAVFLGNRVGMLGEDGTVRTIPPLPEQPLEALADSGCADGPASAARFSMPDDVALSPDGKRLYVVDPGNLRIRVIVFE